MSLYSALQIGRSGLTASQLALQVAGNNMANAASPGYTRQSVRLAPLAGQSSGLGAGAGNGVFVQGISRQIDEALMARLRSGLSDDAAAQSQFNILAQLESSLGDLSGNSLSGQLTSFFKTWSERANLTKSSAVVVQQGQALAGYIRGLRTDLINQREMVDQQLSGLTQRAGNLLEQVAGLNTEISNSELGGTPANALRDQRDMALAELATLMDITAVPQANGSVDVLVGSTPVVIGGQSRGLEFKRTTENGQLKITVHTKTDGSELPVLSGQIGSMIANRGEAIGKTLETLDKLSAQLIFQMNRLHSTATNASGVRSTTGFLQVASGDRTRPMNDPANASFGELPWAAKTGSFTVNVKNTATGTTQSITINVDLDGITNAGTPGTTDDMTPEQLRAALAGVPGLSASFTPDGKLSVQAADGFEFSFADDSSGVLAVVGLNAYFTGTGADDIAVASDLVSDPAKLLVGRMINGTFVENGTALEMVKLQTAGNQALGGVSITQAWTDATQLVGVQTDAAKTRATAAGLVRENLEAQRAGLSGVSLDEESINLLQYQRQYQAAARVVATADELMQVLINLV